MKANELKDWVDLAKKKPLATGALILLLTGGSGASIGAFATKGYVEEKHGIAMQRIEIITHDQERFQEQMSRVENKIDRLLLRGR